MEERRLFNLSKAVVNQGTACKFSNMQEGQLHWDGNWLSVYCNVQHVT